MNSEFYISIPSSTLASAELSSTAKLLYGLLAFRQGGNDDSHWGLRAMAKDLGVTKGAIQKAVDQLERSGLVQVVHGSIKTKNSGGSTNHYATNRTPESTLIGPERTPESTPTDTREYAERTPESTEKKHTKETTKETGENSVSPPSKHNPQAEEKTKPQDVVDYWNNKFQNTDIPKVAKLSTDRIKRIKARFKSPEFAKGFRGIIDMAFDSPFLMGRVKSWNIKFDWLIKNDENWLKILEGNYSGDGDNSKPSASNSGPVEGSEEWWAMQEHHGEKFDQQNKIGQYAGAKS